jgi:hypothetical protein
MQTPPQWSQTDSPEGLSLISRGGSAIIHPHYEKWVRNMLNAAREAAAKAKPEKKPETSN